VRDLLSDAGRRSPRRHQQRPGAAAVHPEESAAVILACGRARTTFRRRL